MADYCTKCSKEMFGAHAEPDIDIEAEFSKIKTNKYLPVLCEGCGMIAIGNNSGELVLAYPKTKENPRELGNFEWITMKEYNECVEPCKSYDPVEHKSVNS